MKNLKTIQAVFRERPFARTLEVIEFLPVEPSNYVWEAGWLCADEGEELSEGIDQTDYFVSEEGIVYQGDKTIGVAPEIKAEADRRERELDSDDREGATDAERNAGTFFTDREEV